MGPVIVFNDCKLLIQSILFFSAHHLVKCISHNCNQHVHQHNNNDEGRQQEEEHG